MEYSESLHAVFEVLGVKLSEIDDWNCCGGAAAHSMDTLLGLALPARNIAKAQDRDLPLAIPCPGCFNALKRAQHALEHDAETAGKLEEVVGFKYRGDLEVKAMHEVLLEQIGLETVSEMVKKPLRGMKVVSYYGCALVRRPEVVGEKDYENPVFMDNIVTALGGEALDWSYKVECCGADLGMSHAKIVENMADHLMGMAIEAGADCVSTGCGLCQVNLDMRQTGENAAKIPVMYYTELMGIALDVPGREWWWDKHIVSPRPMLRELGLS